MTAKLQAIADAADIIVNGYCFTQTEAGISVLNLNAPDKAALLKSNGEMIETSMDDIELEIVRDYLKRNLKYMVA